MPIQAKDLHPFLYKLLSHPAFPQVAPFIVLLVLPLCILLIVQSIRRSAGFTSYFYMVFQTLGLSFPWSWSTEDTHSTSSTSGHGRRKPRKKHRRADSTTSEDTNPVDIPDGGYYPGLVNVSGTYCFMNSTLQAMASLSYLDPYIEQIHARAEALDVPSPVTDAIRGVLHTLNTTRSAPYALRPLEIISALSTRPASDGTLSQSALFSSREHQDAQELFQLVSECLKSEATAIDREALRDRGLSGLSGLGDAGADGSGREVLSRGVFDGLTANRRSCVECGYTEAVMHFAFDNWQLSMPRTAACRLEDCIADYTRLELLTDCICRKCSILATHKRLEHEAEKLAEAVQMEANPSVNKKKRAKEARKLEARVRLMIEGGRIEEDVKGVKMDKVFSRASTKQAMIARPPRVLVLHLNRSIHFGNFAGKNTCRVVFSEILDLTPYSTSGKLSTMPSVPISSPAPALPRSRTPTPATYANSRTLYRLAAVVCHYGQHSFGHYVCFRRKPHPTDPYRPPTLACISPECECERCVKFGPVRADDGTDVPPGSRRGWLRISDDSVSECGIESVLAEGSGAFMLYYERVLHPRPGPYPLGGSPRSSEETVRPDLLLNGHANGSTTSIDTLSSLPPADSKSMLSTSPAAMGNGFASVGFLREKSVEPRIVRSVAAGRGRSMSSAPSDGSRGSSVPAPSAMNGHAHHVQDGSLTPKKGDIGAALSRSWTLGSGSGSEPVSLLDVAPSASSLLDSIPIPISLKDSLSEPSSPATSFISSASSSSSSMSSNSSSVSFSKAPPSINGRRNIPPSLIAQRMKPSQALHSADDRPLSPPRVVDLRA